VRSPPNDVQATGKNKHRAVNKLSLNGETKGELRLSFFYVAKGDTADSAAFVPEQLCSDSKQTERLRLMLFFKPPAGIYLEQRRWMFVP
jgi:hypothetical protein